MAKFKIAAGAEIDMLTNSELRKTLSDTMASWMAEVTTGARYARFSAAGLIAGAALQIGGAERADDNLGPAPGFVWDVRRLRISGLADADVASVYVNDANPSSMVASTADVSGGLFLWGEQVVLYPGDSLLVAGASLTATGYVTVSGQVRELPMALAWRLGG